MNPKNYYIRIVSNEQNRVPIGIGKLFILVCIVMQFVGLPPAETGYYTGGPWYAYIIYPFFHIGWGICLLIC